MSELKNEQLVDVKERIRKLNEELIPLLSKHKLGLGAEPFIRPDGGISARPVLIDELKKAESPSPEDQESESNGLAAA